MNVRAVSALANDFYGTKWYHTSDTGTLLHYDTASIPLALAVRRAKSVEKLVSAAGERPARSRGGRGSPLSLPSLSTPPSLRHCLLDGTCVECLHALSISDQIAECAGFSATTLSRRNIASSSRACIQWCNIFYADASRKRSLTSLVRLPYLSLDDHRRSEGNERTLCAFKFV